MKKDDPKVPIGDIDLFFDGDGCAEVNILIASPGDRQQGYAGEALTLAMQYAIQRLNTTKFVAKIKHDNMASRAFFEKMGFRPEDGPAAKPNVFGEIVYVIGAGDVPIADLTIKSNFSIEV